MRHLRYLPGLLAILCLAVPLGCFASDAIGSRDPAARAKLFAPTVVDVQVSDSITDLGGPWQFEPGDSPIVNGQLEWAQPGFDDSGWGKMDLHSTPDTKDPSYDNGNYVPGWSAKGYPTLTGYAWYRLRLHVANPSQTLSIKMPDHVDDSYQLFANGHLLGQFGNFSKGNVATYRTRPLTFLLPPPAANGEIVLAVRFYAEPLTLGYGSTPDSGGMLQTPIVGLPAAVESVRAAEMAERVSMVIFPVFVSFMLFVAAGGAGWVWLLDRQKPVYLWLTLALLFAALADATTPAAFLSYLFTSDWFGFISDYAITLSLASWVFFWRYWFGLTQDRWSRPSVVTLVALLALCDGYVYLWSASATVFHVHLGSELQLIGNELFGILLLITLMEGLRKDRTAAMLALLPILLLTVGAASNFLLILLRVATTIYIYGIPVGISDIAAILMMLVIGVLVARRFVGTQVAERLERQSIDQDLEQASELQQKVIIPEPIVSEHFAVESDYRPARTVGGDFFQVILGPDGSLLVVVGDVSGKGVPAAMLVAVLVGSIRTKADAGFEPESILKALNDRLVGRAGGHFATCVAAHIKPDGTMKIANAGHIPPYSNGAPLQVEGSIPLGIIEGMEYDVQTFKLTPRQTLTFLTDGVLEARNVSGELLGFNRLARLSTLSASDIADTAVEFGQDDDITVVEVKFGARFA